MQPSTNIDPSPRAGGAMVSLLFWVNLLVAGVLFGAATLSGKVLELDRRAVEVAIETQRVTQLAKAVHRLELKKRALETDPDYVAAVARQKLAGTSLPSAAALEPELPPIDVPRDRRLEMLRPWMHRIATDSLLRARLLMAAAAIVLFSFTFLHDRRGTTAS